MSGDLTARDVIARDLHQLCIDRWNQFDGASTRHGVEVHHKTADVAVAALAAAGWRLERDDQWEWNVREQWGALLLNEWVTEEEARGWLQSKFPRTLVRRRPAGEEVAP